MTAAERQRQWLKATRTQRTFDKRASRLILAALRLQQAEGMELVRRGEFDAATLVQFDERPIREAYIRLYQEVGVPYARSASKRIQKEGFNPDHWNDVMEQFVNTELGNQITWVTHTSQQTFVQSVRSVIALAEVEQLSVSEMSNQIRSKVGFTQEYRSRRIARTEVLTAANYATSESISSLGVNDQLVKVWLSSQDERTRDAHIHMDGQSVPMTGTFDVDGFPAQYPGDPSLPADLRINCRCQEVFEFTDEDEFDESIGLSDDDFN